MKYITSVLLRLGLCFTCFLSTSVWAQNMPTSVYGTIIDSFTGKTISGVEVSVLRADSSVVCSTIFHDMKEKANPNQYAIFAFEVPEQPSGHLMLRLVHPNYQTVYKRINLVWRKKSTQLNYGNITMRRLPKEQKLDEVIVTATKIKFYHKGDTLVYNADAFLLQEGSMLDALIAQLPGTELFPDGRIMVQGKFIESLLLNGRDFFKGDNTVLLDNLPAYMVKHLQVYHEESEVSKVLGKKVDKGKYVMDVKLKRQYSIGWLANAEVGGGTSDRYLARLFAMRYTPHSRVSVFGNLNNVNDRRKPDGNGGWGEFDPTGGLTTGKRGGVDYNIYDKRKRFELSGSAEVNYSDNENSMGGSSSEFYESGDVHNTVSKYSKSSDLSLSTRHDFRFRMGNAPSRVGTSFQIQPNFRYYKNDFHGMHRNGTFSELPSGGFFYSNHFSLNWQVLFYFFPFSYHVFFASASPTSF